MLKITYKSGEIKEVQEPFKVSKEEYNLIEKVEKPNEYRKYVENACQGFIHSVNMLSRNGQESPFSNISIFDRPKLAGLLSDDNMGWYFQKEDAVDGVPERAIEDCGDRDWIHYLIDIIIQLEDIYMDVVDNGDPLHDHRPIEFPVNTINVSRAHDQNDQAYFEDPESVDWYCSHDIPRYNIYLSEGMKIASCCFSKDQLFSYYNEQGKLTYESFNTFVSKYIGEDLKQYTIPENERKYKVEDPSTGEKVDITGVLRRDNQWGEMIQIELEDGSIIKATPDQLFLDKNSGQMVSAKEMLENPEKYEL